MTDSRAEMTAALAYLLDRAKSTDPDDALHTESPLSVERSGKYVDVLFSTGGPHTEFLAEYEDDEAAEYWFESEPVGGWFTRMDWGTRDDIYVGREDASRIMSAIMRDVDNLATETGLSCSECGEVGTYRAGTVSDVVCSECGNEVNMVDFQPDDGESIRFNDDGVLCVYGPAE